MTERAREWEGNLDLRAVRREEAHPWGKRRKCIHMRVRWGVEVDRGLEEKGRFQAEGHLPFSLPTVRMGEELALKAMTSARLRLFELSLGS